MHYLHGVLSFWGVNSKVYQKQQGWAVNSVDEREKKIGEYICFLTLPQMKTPTHPAVPHDYNKSARYFISFVKYLWGVETIKLEAEIIKNKKIRVHWRAADFLRTSCIRDFSKPQTK